MLRFGDFSRSQLMPPPADSSSPRTGGLRGLLRRRHTVPISPHDPDDNSADGLLSRLSRGLARSKISILAGLGSFGATAKLDDTMLDTLEACLIEADMGLEASDQIIAAIRHERYDKTITEIELRRLLADKITALLKPAEQTCPLDRPNSTAKPRLMLVIGVNGCGKTTLLGKLARRYQRSGQNVMLVAADTFRAAAVAQLQRWGERENIPVIAGEPGCNAAGLVYQACEQARIKGIDLLLIDTAGRLQNKSALMDELQKIYRLLQRHAIDVKAEILLVLDATIGLNNLRQVELFNTAAPLTGIAMNKLDGSARGGSLVAIAAGFEFPIYYLGIGENADDIETFNAADFAAALVDVDPISPAR